MTIDVEQLIALLQPLREQGLSPMQAAQTALANPAQRSAAASSPAQQDAALAQALLKVFSPLTAAELAVILHELFPKQSAVQIGQAILDPKVLPLTTPQVMLSALTGAGFSTDNSTDAVNILYPITTTVQANQAWQASGLTVTGRQATRLVASGRWTANPANGMSGPAGDPRFSAKPGYTLPGAPEGALVARIGNNAPFVVGTGVQVPTGQSGALQLCINDDLDGRYGAGLRDNQGSLQVQITTS